MGEFFGTDGIRGLAGKFPLDETTIECIGYSLAGELQAKLGRSAHIIIGRDTRESGEWIESAFARGASAVKANVRSAGVVTTPGVAYLARVLEADAGVVISASHNPYEDNGIKIFGRSGRKLDEDTEAAIERCLKSGLNCSLEDTLIQTDESLAELYFNYLLDEIGKNLDLHGLKLVVDGANGAAYKLAPALMKSLGALVTSINVEPNGHNINLKCGALNCEQLQKTVIEQQADLGLAFDGDADRLLLVDDNGKLVDGDQILFILANHLDAKGSLAGRRVVATVMSNLGLEVALYERNIVLVRTPVGDKYVLEELLANGGSIGGEQSGHVILPQISLAGDGMITALEVLRVMKESGKSLSQLTEGFRSYPQVIVNVPVSKKPPLDDILPIKEAIDNVERVLGKRGRLLVRYSGTEHLARVMLEGPDKAAIQTQADDLANLIREHIG